MKTYKVLKADFPLLVQDKVLTTGMVVELEENEQVKSLLEAGILKEETEKKKKEAKDG
ncbi:hypothetical protein [Pampinifervens florentissimum]|uniref:hypothetical protein n=1 Tax=Pampinifervens florentissimum TaxID=1632019 RepID=UPI0013B481C4|nr:hypothetical protein [Hydrogenobacter sp. T-8]QID32326.1 hypothetical protein G3M65_00430 [Hydrogenobacter sp. T-8]